MSRIVLTIMMFILVSCGTTQPKKKMEVFSPAFLAKINVIKDHISKGEYPSALSRLNDLKDPDLTSNEKAYKYNLLGIVSFSQNKFQDASVLFKEAYTHAKPSYVLSSKISLNLTSTLYKMNEYDKAYFYLNKILTYNLEEKERNNYYKLKYLLAQLKNDSPAVISSALNLMEGLKSFQEIESSPYKESLIDHYSKLGDKERLQVLQKLEGRKELVVGYLGKYEVQTLYYSGNRSNAKGVLSWLSSHFGSFPEIKDFVNSFENQMQSFAKLNQKAIGIVLPLQGKKANFGKKALRGIEAAFKTKKRDFDIHVANDNNRPEYSRSVVRDLITRHNVAFVVGGLFPQTAKEEYLEARKYGVLFISLSPVYLPREDKNHLLVEIPGSVESQIKSVLKPDQLEKLGKKVAVFFSTDDRGYSYIKELWKEHQNNNIEITSVARFPKDAKDYRDYVTEALGLSFPLERKEEEEEWKKIYSIKGKKYLKRAQLLKPIVDFDWVFMPVYPPEAIQAISTFGYYDAKSLLYIGGPSWKSRSLITEQRNLGKLAFTSSLNEEGNIKVTEEYKKLYNKEPGFIENLGFKGIQAGLTVLGENSFDNRENLESYVKEKGKISVYDDVWNLEDGVWIKEMGLYRIRNRKITRY